MTHCNLVLKVGENMQQRDNNGRFVKGNTVSKGHGRRTRQVESDYMAVVVGTVTLDSWRVIVQRAVQDAQNGDSNARTWLTKLLVGERVKDLTHVLADVESERDTVQDELDNRRLFGR